MEDSPQMFKSSDDSDDDSPVRVKKPRSTRTVRCIPQSFLEEQKNVSYQANVYTTRVQCVMKELRAGRISASDLGIDEEQDGNDSTPFSDDPKRVKKRGHRIHVSFSSSDEDTENTETSFSVSEDSFHVNASPSPPPSPHASLMQRPVRMSKVTKTALRNIERAALSLRENAANLSTSFTDIESDLICMGEEQQRDLTVKVEYKGDVRKYTMKRHSTFSLIKSMIAVECGFEESRVMLYNGDKAIHQSDTPASIGLHVADILNCYVDTTSMDKREDYATETDNAITLSIQSQNLRQKMQYTVDRTKPMQYLIDRLAADRGLRTSDVRLRFDGDDVFPMDSAMDLELEDGFCLDLMD